MPSREAAGQEEAQESGPEDLLPELPENPAEDTKEEASSSSSSEQEEDKRRKGKPERCQVPRRAHQTLASSTLKERADLADLLGDAYGK